MYLITAVFLVVVVVELGGTWWRVKVNEAGGGPPEQNLQYLSPLLRSWIFEWSLYRMYIKLKVLVISMLLLHLALLKWNSRSEVLWIKKREKRKEFPTFWPYISLLFYSFQCFLSIRVFLLRLVGIFVLLVPFLPF